MKIRQAADKDILAVKELFRQTILSVNLKDYTVEQAECWASKGDDESVWEERIRSQYFIVAEDKGIITGFAALNPDGYLNSMFVHKDYQNMGIATALLENIESYAAQKGLNEITADVSITAKPFFLNKGYKILHEQTVDIGIEMTNYKLTKSMS